MNEQVKPGLIFESIVMPKRKNKNFNVRYIVRVTQALEKPGKKTFVKYSRNRSTYTTTAANEENQLKRNAKVFKSTEQLRRFVDSQYKNFKKQKKYSNFNINVQAFKGRLARGKYLRLTSKAVSAKKIRSMNIKKTDTSAKQMSELNRVLGIVRYRVREEMFTPIPKAKRKRGRGRVKDKTSFGTKKTPLLLTATRERMKQTTPGKGKTMYQAIKELKQREKKRRKK